MRAAALVLSLTLFACGSPPNQPPATGPSPAPAQSQQAQGPDLSRELAAAHLEIFQLKLRIAKLEGRPQEEARLIREDGLTSRHDAIRVQAIREILSLPPDRQKAYRKEMVEASQCGPAAVRVEAVAALAQSGAESDVIALVADPSADVRRAVAMGLTSASPDALDALLKLLPDREPAVRIAALESARTAKNADVLDRILGIVQKDRDPRVVEKALDILGAIAAPAAAGPLQRVLKSTSDDAIRWAAINALGKIGVPESAPAVRPYMSRSHAANLREIAAQALGKMRDLESIAALGAVHVEDAEPRVREAAGHAILRMLVGADADGRARVVEAVVPLGKAILGALAAAVADTSIRDRQAVLDAGNAIAGTSFTDVGKAAQIAETWKALLRP